MLRTPGTPNQAFDETAEEDGEFKNRTALGEAGQSELQ